MCFRVGVEFGVSHHARTYYERAREQGAEENVGTGREEVTGELRKIHNEVLQNIIRMIKSGMREKVGALARMGETRNDSLPPYLIKYHEGVWRSGGTALQ
jgi:hypothetical protein